MACLPPSLPFLASGALLAAALVSCGAQDDADGGEEDAGVQGE